LIHRAAYKNGLSRSLYAPKDHVNNLNGDLLSEFRAKHFNTDRIMLIGTGISHENLIRHGKYFRLQKSEKPFTRPQSVYQSGELREDNFDELVHASIAFEGVSLSSKDHLVSDVIANIFGCQGPRVKFSLGGNRLSKTCIQLASKPALINAFNAKYTDTGLFGFQIISDHADVGKVTYLFYHY
jgi:predicted Zn-dependent peptidase